jgi:predicted CopG family antitoxin
MPTTVQVSEETRRLLGKLKKSMGLNSYEQVIKNLVKSKENVPESLFGVCKGSAHFKREKEAEHAL